MTTELDSIAKKNTQQKIDEVQKKLNIKKHNIKAAQKAHSEDPDREEHWTGYGLKTTEKSKSLTKEKNKVKKSEKWVDKQEDKLHEHGVWSKKNKKGSALATIEKKKIIEKGFPSKAKFAGGGVALRGIGRAVMKKGGKV